MDSIHTARRGEIQDVIEWLITEGLNGTHYAELLETLCHKMEAAGIQLMRMNLSMRAYHPEFGAFAYRWKRADGIIHEQYERNTTEQTGWLQSPLKYTLDNNLTEFRARLTPDHEPFEYPVFYDLQQQGATEYLITGTPFSSSHAYLTSDDRRLPEGMQISWTTDHPEGFSDVQVAEIQSVLPALGLALKSNSNYEMAQDLLSTYLGGDAGARVLSGDIVRGSVDNIQAVILYFDLQGFTKLSEILPAPEIIAMLNDYFGAVVPAIHAHGGNVLKFMGDGLLAIFATDQVEDANLAALETIDAFNRELPEISRRREANQLQSTGFTVGVHAGDVLYGNIGASDRLDFTVIGSAVNTTARISAMCSNVDQAIVISGKVAQPLLERRADLVSLGHYRLRGVADRLELFTLD